MSKLITVIGSGPGGYVAAIRAAQRGAVVTIIEKEHIGGVCLNVGCIPTKALFKNAAFLQDIKHSSELGVDIKGYELNFPQAMKRKDAIVKKLTSGVGYLLKKNNVKVISGEAEIVHKNEVKVHKTDGNTEVIKTDYIIIATGSVPIVPPIPGLDLDGVMTSKELLSIKELPKSMAIIGGGVIGMEFASIFNMMGVDISIIERLPNILPNLDEEITDSLRKELTKRQIEFHTSTDLQRIEKVDNGLKLTTSKGEMIVEKVLLSVGRKAVIPKLGDAKVEIGKGYIQVNDFLQTNIDNIYCIGDANGILQLAHVASAEGIVAVDHIMTDHHNKMSYKTVPSVVYTLPEIASVGLTEKEAKAKTDIKVARFNYQGNGKALCMQETVGYAKVITDTKYNEILGVHIFGYDASNLIAEAGLALNLEATADEVAKTIHAHPSIAEIIYECCEELEFKSVHI